MVKLSPIVVELEAFDGREDLTFLLENGLTSQEVPKVIDTCRVRLNQTQTRHQNGDYLLQVLIEVRKLLLQVTFKHISEHLADFLV